MREGYTFETRSAELLALEDNWNSYGAPAINPAVIERAKPFYDLLASLGCTPWLTPMNNGGVAIERAHKVDDFMIEFEPDGSASFFCDALGDNGIRALIGAAQLRKSKDLPTPNPESTPTGKAAK